MKYLAVYECVHGQVVVIEDDEGHGTRIGSRHCCPYYDSREVSRVELRKPLVSELIAELENVEAELA